MSGALSQTSVDEDVLVDYLQGNLSSGKRASLEKRLAEDSDARRVVAALASLSIFSSTTSGVAPKSERDASGGEVPAHALPDPVPGELLADKYRVVAPLGRGAMGLVLEVEHVLLRERYALKLLRRATASDPMAVQRLVREARAAMRIDSPHVARVFDLGVLPDGRLFLVMELLAGRDLKSILAERGALPLETAISYLRQAALGVRAAHAAAIVHRDLKPANLFVAEQTGGECLKVVDFGLSKAPEVHRRVADEATLTTSGSMIGSPMYMAPEQIRDAKSADERSDIWALGVVLYEMVTGRPPYSARTVSGVLAAIMVDPPRPCAERGVPAAFERLLLDCLAKVPEERIGSADELLRRLDRWREDDAPAVASGASPGHPPGRLRRWPFVALALVVAATTAAIAGSRSAAPPSARTFDLPVAALADAARAPSASADATAPASAAPPAPAPSAQPVETAGPEPRATARPRPAKAGAAGPRATASAADEVVFGKETDGRR